MLIEVYFRVNDIKRVRRTFAILKNLFIITANYILELYIFGVFYFTFVPFILLLSKLFITN